MANEKKIEKKRKPKFQRTKFRAYVKLGKGQKSKQKYRRATGRHNKTRQKWKSHPPMVEIGYKNKEEIRGLIKGKTPVYVNKIADLIKIKENSVAVLGKVGLKKKMEIIKEADKKKIRFANLNIKKFLRKAERAIKHREKVKKDKAEAKAKADKKAEKKAKKTENQSTDKNKDITNKKQTDNSKVAEQAQATEEANKEEPSDSEAGESK
jgi:ribosomal protein L32E